MFPAWKPLIPLLWGPFILLVVWLIPVRGSTREPLAGRRAQVRIQALQAWFAARLVRLNAWRKRRKEGNGGQQEARGRGR
jgi:hypothetical protein